MSLKISSEKINNPFLVDLLEKLADSFRKMNHDFFIIGATARDIIIQQMLNTSSRRKTRDLDLAIAVPNWQEFDKIKNSLIADAFVKPYRKYAIPRSVNNFRSKAKKIISFSTRDELTIGQLEAIRASLNSYLGYLGHYKSYKIIHKSLTGSAVFKHLYFASGYKKSIPYKRYTNKRRERCEIAHDLNRILTA